MNKSRTTPKLNTSRPIAELRAHVQQLCKQHEIQLVHHHGDHLKEDHADLDDRIITVREIKSRVSYAVALHEIGHLVTRTKTHPRLFQEGTAWQWAKRNALCWSKSMERCMLRGLNSYLEAFLVDYQQALPGQLRAPPRDHVFWTLLHRDKRVRALFKQRLPQWLHPELITIPWGNLLSHPDRPRCSNCSYWRHLVTSNLADTREKLSMGECIHRLRPLGVETTPSGALCGSSWVRKPG